MRRLCVFWYWVMEHAEDTSTLPKTTAKLRVLLSDTLCHISLIDWSSSSQKPGKSQEWTATRVSFINATHLTARTILNEPLIALFYRQGTEKWPKLSWECMVCLPPDPGLLHENKSRKEGELIQLAPPGEGSWGFPVKNTVWWAESSGGVLASNP